MVDKLNLVLAHPKPDVLTQIHEAVEGKHTVIARCNTVAELHRATLGKSPDLIITGIAFPDGDGLDTIIKLGQINPLPAVIVTSKRSLALVQKAMLDHVMAYLIEPPQPDELHAAIVLAHGRFRQLEELQGEVEDLRQALDDRKVIERAKGVLMAKHNIAEPDAFAMLRKAAQDGRMKLAEAGRRVLDEHA